MYLLPAQRQSGQGVESAFLTPERPQPIPPQSQVRLVRADANTPEWQTELGRRFRVGYYSPQDGLDCVWLLDDSGTYCETTDHDFLYKYFEVEYLSDETDYFGENRPPLEPLT